MNDRVPPGQHLVSGFPVLHVGPVPPFDPKTWRLRVFGFVEEERSYTYAELTSGTLFPLTSVQTDFHCVTTWSKLDNIWEGVKFTDLLAQRAAAAWTCGTSWPTARMATPPIFPWLISSVTTSC